jgi:hypothetical protein
VYVNQIIEIIENLERNQWQVSVPFGRDLSPLGGVHAEVKAHPKVEDFGGSGQWLKLLQETNQAFDLSGITLKWWTKIPNLDKHLREKAEAGCRIRILLVDQENPMLSQFVNCRPMALRHDYTPPSSMRTFSYFSEIAKAAKNLEVRLVKNGHLTFQIVRNDARMVFSPLMYSVATSQAPLFECSPESSLFHSVAAEFDTLWDINSKNDVEIG